MAEILTESFCERCGTRYTFESNAPRGRGVGRFRTLSQGLKNFVMSDDTSLDEALAAARSDAERETVAQQLDAFHKTFNFCMTCRQYTCGNCWNEAEGRCLTCAPHLGHEIMPAPFPQVQTNGNGAHAAEIEGLAWPTTDLRPPEPPPAPVDAWPEDELAPNALADRLASLGIGSPAVEETTESVVDEPVEAEPEALEAVAEPLDAFEADAEAAREFEAAPDEVVVEAESAAVVAFEAEPGDAATLDAPADVATDQLPAIGEAERPDLLSAQPDGSDPTTSAPAETVNDRAAAAAAQTAALLARFRPGQSLDEALEAYEAAAAAAEAEPEQVAEAVVGDGAVTEPEPELEAVAAEGESLEPVAPEVDLEPEPEPELIAAEPVVAEPPVAAPPETTEPATPVAPLAAEAQPAPIPEPAPRVDVVETPTWRIVAPDVPSAADGHPAPTASPEPPAMPAAASADPQWPTTPQWPTAVPRQESEALTFLSARMDRSGEDVWAASAREILSTPPVSAATPPPAIQSCVSCGLSLSANARFCRRCGTPQG